MKIDVTVRGSGEVISINVKEGRQTFKWLAQVVQSRLIATTLNPTKTIHGDESRSKVVSSITNSKDELINPRDSIMEHADPDGNCKVHAHVVSTFPSDVWGNPVYDDWMTAAYLRSEVGIHWASEMSAWRDRLANAVVDSSGKPIADSASSSLSPRGGTSSGAMGSFIQVGDDPDPQSAFELDWGQMKWNWLPSSQQTDVQLSHIRMALRNNYQVIIRIFTHYCGSGVVGQRYGMTMTDHAHLLHALGIINLAKEGEADRADAYFERVVGKSRAVASTMGVSSHPLLSRPQLAQALASIAIDLELDQTTIHEAIEALLSGLVHEYWEKLAANVSLYCINDEILPMAIRDYYSIVKQAFLAFAVHDAIRGPEITLPDLMQLLVASTLVFKDQTEPLVACFLQAQISLPALSEARELQSLVYCEFLEAVSRLAIQTIDTNAALGPGKRVRMALSMLCELQDHAPRRK